MRFATTSQTPFTPLSPPRPPRPMLAPPLHASKRSSLIDYLQTKEQPPPEWHRRCHPTYIPRYQWTLVLSYLPNTSLLSLRLTDRRTNIWASEASPRPFANLHIEFPTPSLPALKADALESVARQCRHLTITFPTGPLTTNTPSPENARLPTLKNLTRLHLVCPITDVFDRLLPFRLALQRSTVPGLTHLSIANLSINGIMALRCGAFTSFAESTWTDRMVWRKLQGLDVELIPWCDYLQLVPTPGRTLVDKCQRDKWCTGFKILHDWLNSFATMGTLREFTFAWRGAEGPNPLLLGEFAKKLRWGNWFSAPPIRFRSLREVWLRGVRVEVEDVRHMRMRIEGLELLMVEGRLAGEGVRGVLRVVGGREWFEVSLRGGGGGFGGELVLEGEKREKREHVVCGKGVEGGSVMAMPIRLDNTPVRGSRMGRYFW